MFAIFTVDTISGHHRIAVKTRKSDTVADLRHDAYSIALSEWGRGARLLSESTTARRLPKVFAEASSAREWGFVDWSRV